MAISWPALDAIPVCIDFLQAHIKFGEDKVQVKLITDPSKAPVPQPKFRSELVTQQLRTSSTGRLLLSCAEISSTQTFLQENMRSFPDGTVCVADAQTAGKGKQALLQGHPKVPLS